LFNSQFLKNVIIIKEEFEDTKGIIRIGNSRKDRKNNGRKKKDKQLSMKYYTENKKLSNTISLKTGFYSCST